MTWRFFCWKLFAACLAHVGARLRSWYCGFYWSDQIRGPWIRDGALRWAFRYSRELGEGDRVVGGLMMGIRKGELTRRLLKEMLRENHRMPNARYSRVSSRPSEWVLLLSSRLGRSVRFCGEKGGGRGFGLKQSFVAWFRSDMDRGVEMMGCVLERRRGKQLFPAPSILGPRKR